MADTIEESLRSVVEDIPEEYEIVIVDESDDGTREIINDLEIPNPINKIYVDDLGYSRSRNLAVEKASGDIVLMHVDMDDWYDSRYFEPFVELYERIREARDGRDFWLSCQNFNITGRKAYLDRYELKDLPLGPGEREYRWRLVTADEYFQVDMDETVSGRIQLSERKTLSSRAKRAYKHIEGLFTIGYSVRRIVGEEVFGRGDPLSSQVYKLAILPIAFVTSQFQEDVDTAVPEGGGSLASEMERRTYTISELRDTFDLEEKLKLDAMIDRED
jgi:glycosyltransferase involved in cell wall biosynthesis